MLAPPRLVVFSGLPGVGKSTIAGEVAKSLGAAWLRVDTIEAAILKAGLVRSFQTGLAAYVVASDVASECLGLGLDVVVDAVNGVEPARAMWRDLARTRPARLFPVEVLCRDAVEHRRRLAARDSSVLPLPAPTWLDVEAVAREFVPWNDPVLRVDGLAPPAENVARVLSYCTGPG